MMIVYIYIYMITTLMRVSSPFCFSPFFAFLAFLMRFARLPITFPSCAVDSKNFELLYKKILIVYFALVALVARSTISIYIYIYIYIYIIFTTMPIPTAHWGDEAVATRAYF
jgi:hypothetical protein